MPRETPATPEQAGAERPFAERRDVLFEKLVKKASRWDEEDRLYLVERVFEHSVEDGIRFAQQLSFTPDLYQRAIASVSFALKHPKVFSALRTETRQAFSRDKRDRDIYSLHDLMSAIQTSFSPQDTTGTRLTEKGQQELRQEQKMSRDPNIRAIDDLYLDALTQRYPKLKVQEREGTERRSKGETLAERYLNASETVLEKRFYTGPVKDMFPVLARDPLFRHPTVLETDLLTVLKNSRIQADAALTRLEPARVVAYSQLDTIKRGIAERELVKELKNELPEGKTVALDREEGVYRVEDESGKDRTNEKSETKSEEERMAEFEERVMDEMEKFWEKGMNADSIVSCLAGLDSERAWKLRKQLWKEGAVKAQSLAESLAGIDSLQAWEMRRTLPQLKGRSMLQSLPGCDSVAAWIIREAYLNVYPEEVGYSLAGLDSERAWKTRKYLMGRVNVPVIFLSLAGLDSERAWKLRESLEAMADAEEVPIALSTLHGLDSESAQKMRDRLLKSAPKEYVMRSLTGLDSEVAWKYRWLYLDKGWELHQVAASLAGLDSERAWDMRRKLKTKVPEGVAQGLSGDSESFVWRLNPKIRAKIGMEGKDVEIKSELTTRERLVEYDEKILDMMEQALSDGVSLHDVCHGLCGFDSPRAWRLRDKVFTDIKKQAPKDRNFAPLGSSLAGLDTERAWKMRDELLDAGAPPEVVADGLTGLDSARAWKFRKDRMWDQESQFFILQSLAGLATPRAEKMRADLLANGASLVDAIIGLTGVDTPEAWKIRQKLLDGETDETVSSDDIGEVALSLVGLDTSKAWKMREWLIINQGYIDSYLLEGLAGLDSERAWQFREKLINRGEVAEHSIIGSLAGLDSARAWKLRRETFLRTQNIDLAVDELAGGPRTFVWRLRKEPFGKSEEMTGPWQDKLTLLNLVHNPTLEGIHEHHAAHPVLPPQAGLSQHQADVLSELFSDRSAARALLATNAAIPDRAPERLADALFRRMAPRSVREPHPSLGSRLTSAFNAFSSDGRPPLTSAVTERSSYELFGGGSENLADTRTVLEAREAADELLVQGAYGRYDVQKKTWEKVHFPVRRDISGPTKETTLTLVNVAGAGRVSLPLSLDARLIAERVKGVTSGGKEIALEVSVDSLGQASVQVPSGVTRILYSVEQPLAPEPLHDPSPKEFEAYLRTFQREHGKEMATPLARLPHDVEAEVKSRVFQALSPKQKMVRVEALVREFGWYDTRNEEVSREKFGKTPEEQVAITEERLEALKTREKSSALAGKKFAGVCADFSLITATLLRKAGLPAGIMTGIHLTGKTAQMRDMHTTAFVPWPDGRGGIRLVAVDGTPSSAAEAAAGISRPSLADLEDQAEQATEAYVAESKEVIEGLLRSAGAHDLESIRNLKNSKLEHALNVILRYEVKQPHLRVVERLLNAYWYGGLAGKKNRLAQNIQLRELLEEEVARARTEPAGSEESEPAGTRLLETTRDFLSKFQRGGAATSPSEAFDLVERVAELAKNELSDVEHRALIAVITYLRAEKMR